MTDSDDDEENDRVTAHSYGALDASEATNECWLIRIPPKLAQVMEAVPEGTEVGELVFTKGGKVPGSIHPIKPSLTVHLREDATQFLPDDEQSSSAASSSVVPLNYSLQAMTKKVPLLHPFTRNPKTGSVRLLGQITRTANLQVEQDSNYRAMLKDRLVATNVTSQRFVKAVEATESVMAKQQSHNSAAIGSSSSSRNFGSAVLYYGKRKLEVQQEQALQAQGSSASSMMPASKKARQFSPSQTIQSIVFELFSQRQYWTVKDLKAAAIAGGASQQLGTKRADVELRDVLRDIGDFHRSGDQKNMWELRKEFQHNVGGGSGS
jgi:hypothetical protein